MVYTCQLDSIVIGENRSYPAILNMIICKARRWKIPLSSWILQEAERAQLE